MRTLGLVLVFALASGGCASSSSSMRRTKRGAPEQSPTPAPVVPACTVKERVLAPVSRHPRAAMLRALDDGLAVAWSEHIGERDTLRLLVVDAHGVPRSPSAEVTDRDAVIASPDVVLVPGGFDVSWSEPGGRFSRGLDVHGRPRGDVASSPSPSPTSQPAACGRDGVHLSCATPGGPMQLPGDEEPISATPSGAVVSLGASGLRLWLNECQQASSR